MGAILAGLLITVLPLDCTGAVIIDVAVMMTVWLDDWANASNDSGCSIIKRANSRSVQET